MTPLLVRRAEKGTEGTAPIVLGLALACSPCYGQARTEARVTAGADINLPAYRMTRTNGLVILATSYAERNGWYVVVDIRGRNNTYSKSSFTRIEPITAAEAEKEVESVGLVRETLPTPRTGPRVEARTSARTSVGSSPSGGTHASTAASEPAVDYRVSVGPTPTQKAAARKKARPSQGKEWTWPWANVVGSGDGGGGAGYSATGIPLHVGPRGGVYHYSKNGNKVYHSRK